MTKTKQPTVPEILQAYQDAENFATDTAFAEALGWKKQSLSQYKLGIYQPQLSTLRLMAFLEISNWKGRMAAELLYAMGHADQIPQVQNVHWVTPAELVQEDGKKLLEVAKGGKKGGE